MTTPCKVTIGSRASPLSVAQTEEVLSHLRPRFPDVEFAVVSISTGGDRRKDAPLLSLGRGTFVKDIELAVLNGEIDFAVHSAKDLPAPLPEGLALAGTVPRRDPRDALVDRWGLPLTELPAGARLGTSSPRRIAQLKALRPDLEALPIRGNVGTRLEKARGSDYDGVIVAVAGLLRLGREAEITEHLSPDAFTPDVGQGTLAVEVRADDAETIAMLSTIDDRHSSLTLQAERGFLAALGGGCQVPVAAYAQLEGETLRISTMAAVPDGSRIFRTDASYDADDAPSAGRQAARALLDTGAEEIIESGRP